VRTKVQKWGNSLAVRIPKPFAEGAGLRPAAEVELLLENGALRLTPARRRWGLRRLLSRVTKQNLHAEVETGPAVGREVW
jgi:antitoxin MazE